MSTVKNKKVYMSDIRIKSIEGIEFDEIISYVMYMNGAEIIYKYNKAERKVFIEKGAVEIETDVPK